jgi:DNA-binding transcriptional ArsR family regulator
MMIITTQVQHPAQKIEKAPGSRLAAILHPVRLRIILALQGGRLTTQEIRTRMPDVPQATLYRHISHLIQAGVVEVVGRTQVFGTVERTLALVEGQTLASPEEFAKLTPEEMTQYFSIFLGALLEIFSKYARIPDRDFGRDSVTFVTQTVNLTPEEARELRTEIHRRMAEWGKNPALEGRQRRTLAFCSIPHVTNTEARVSPEQEESNSND